MFYKWFHWFLPQGYGPYYIYVVYVYIYRQGIQLRKRRFLHWSWFSDYFSNRCIKWSMFFGYGVSQDIILNDEIKSCVTLTLVYLNPHPKHEKGTNLLRSDIPLAQEANLFKGILNLKYAIFCGVYRNRGSLKRLLC